MHDVSGPVPIELRLPERVDTERLVLRTYTEADAAELGEVITENIEHLRPWMDWIAFEPLAVEDRASLIRDWYRQWSEGGDAVYGAFLDGDLIGGTGLHRRIGDGGLEIGYWLAAAHTGKGYVTEWVAALTSAAFGVADIAFVEIRHDAGNVRSAAVPQRLGFERAEEVALEITLPGHTGTGVIWRILGSDWPH